MPKVVTNFCFMNAEKGPLKPNEQNRPDPSPTCFVRRYLLIGLPLAGR
jgi:hypothetical protein